jgi:hypothetical protein
MNALQAWPALACWPEVINYHTLNDLCIKYGEALLSGPLRISRVRRATVAIFANRLTGSPFEMARVSSRSFELHRCHGDFVQPHKDRLRCRPCSSGVGWGGKRILSKTAGLANSVGNAEGWQRALAPGHSPPDALRLPGTEPPVRLNVTRGPINDISGLNRKVRRFCRDAHYQTGLRLPFGFFAVLGCFFVTLR